MNIKSQLRKSQTILGIKSDLKLLKLFFLSFKRRRMIKKYFSESQTKKLHLGSNITLLDGWLCSDILPQNKKSIYLDVTKIFPFEDEIFDYIYSEHLIEHLSQENGIFMLSECHRVLKKGGKIRIATPDLEVITNLYSKRDKKYGMDYIIWSMDNFAENHCGYDPVVVMNTLFRNWSHQFLYDYNYLKKVMKKTGFSDIVKFNIGESNDTTLKNIERHHINIGNSKMICFETIVVEAEKK